MTRPLRLEHAGAIWHVTSRGNRKESIFLDDGDRHRFLDRLARTVEVCRWRVHAWVLMTNHYHLLLETPEPNLGPGMHRLNAPYSQAFNRRHARVGHVFQGRYRAILVERESHLLELIRYVVLNPVRAGIVRHPGDHPWSSYQETAGQRRPAAWLDVDWTLAQFGRLRRTAQRRYQRFVAEAHARSYRPWDHLSGQIYLGGEAFRRRLDGALARRERSPEIPRRQQALFPRPTLDTVLTAVALAFDTSPVAIRSQRRGAARKAFAVLARRLAAAPLREVAEVLHVTPWTASHSASDAEALEMEDCTFRNNLTRARLLVPDLAKPQV